MLSRERKPDSKPQRRIRVEYDANLGSFILAKSRSGWTERKDAEDAAAVLEIYYAGLAFGRRMRR